MPSLILPSRFGQQPQQAPQIDRGGLGAKAVMVAMPWLTSKNLAGPSTATVGGTAPTGSQIYVDQYGRSLMFHPSGGANGYGGMRFGEETNGTSNDWTFVWVGQPQNYSTANGGLMVRGADLSGAGWNINLTYEVGPTSGSGTGNLVARVVDTSPAAFPVSLIGLSLTVGSHERVAVVKRGTTVKLFNWRTRKVATASAGNGSLRTSGQGVGLAYTTTGATNTCGHNKVNIAMAFAAGLNEAEVWNLLDSPYSVFQAPKRRIWVGAAVQDPMTASPGSLILTGNNATLVAARRMTGAQGSLNLSGAAAGLTAARKLTAATGALTLTGNTANLYGARKLTAAVGALAFTNQSATLLTGKRMSAAAAAYTLSGSAAQFSRGYRVSATTAAYTLSGSAAQFARGYRMTASTGSVVLDGAAAGLRYSKRLVADVGVLTLTGYAAQLLKGFKLSTSAGSLSFSASDAAFRLGYVLPCAAGALTLSGNTASFQVTRRLPVSVGSFTLTGANAGLNYTPLGAFVLFGSPAAYTLGFSDAGLSLTRRMLADQAALDFSFGSAALRAQHKLTADTGALTITGNAAILTYEGNVPVDYSMSCDPAAFTLTGNSAAMRAGRVVRTSATSLAFAVNTAGMHVARRMGTVPGALSIIGYPVSFGDIVPEGRTLTEDDIEAIWAHPRAAKLLTTEQYVTLK